MKILVTGGAGFIGSHVVDEYINIGHQVVVVDNLSTGHKYNLNPKAKFYKMDICSSKLNDIFKKEKPEIVNHHAAQISVPISVKDPLFDAKTNIMGLINVLEACRKNQVKKIIYISSGGAIYGEAEEYPTTENYNPKPLSIYAINKMVGENYLHFYYYQYRLNYTILRYANVYGPRQISTGEAGVVSIFIKKLLNGERPIINTYPDNLNGMIRDYVYVKDVVKANLMVLNNGENEIFNIGTCIETNTLTIFNEIKNQLNIDIQPLFGPARPGDLHRSLISFQKIQQKLGWKPIYNLRMGIAETIKYFIKNKD